MIKRISAIIAAAACAGVMVAFVPGFTPETAIGATRVTQPSVPALDPVASVTGKPAPTTAEIQKAVEQNLRNASHHSKIVCAQSWPHYDQSCLRDGQRADGAARVVRVIDTDRAPAARTGQARR